MAARFDFESLTPEVLLDAVEQAVGEKLSGLAQAHPSYINRVYELQTQAGVRLIAKFYRPGRWSEAALREEHDFVRACAAAEIPVVAPQVLRSGDTLGLAGRYYFAVYPKRWGRTLEVTGDDDWRRLGRVMGRLHLVGQQAPAPHRVVLHPEHSTRADVALLLS